MPPPPSLTVTSEPDCLAKTIHCDPRRAVCHCGYLQLLQGCLLLHPGSYKRNNPDMNLKFCSIQTSGELRWNSLFKSQNAVTDFIVAVFVRQIELHQPAVFTFASIQSQREG